MSAEALVKYFGNRVALEELSLHVESGERFVILGPSGAGKSTFLRIVAGLESPTSGALRICGADVRGVPADRRRVGLLFQEGALFEHLNVAHNLAFPLRMRAQGASARAASVSHTAQQFDLHPLLQRRVSTLSGGERRRVAIARALLSEPDLLLFDEPFVHLDENGRTLLRALLRDRGRLGGRAIVLVTHDHDDALALGDRIAVLLEGRVRQCGTPEEVYESPADTAVARFVGPFPMNIIDGLTIGEPHVLIGVRPQHVHFRPSGGDLRGKISQVAFAGHAWLATVESEAGSIAAVVTGGAPKTGETVALEFAREGIRRFDRTTGKARQ
ncbi:MAG: ABC transporter ATP-binding protein [Vulcanimicrobiaceae bacterium]